MKLSKEKFSALIAIGIFLSITQSLFAIEAFQERFEWGDLSKPTTLHARVAVTDPYDKAAWINVAVFGGNAESGYYWQKYFPGKNLKVYAGNDKVWEKLQSLGKASHNQAVMSGTQASKYTLVEITVHETEKNHRVVTAIKEIPEVAGTLNKPRSIHQLPAYPTDEAISNESWASNRRMRYDVMIPGIGGISDAIDKEGSPYKPLNVPENIFKNPE